MRLSAHVTGSLSPVITAPAEWIARLLSVLLDNAVRHSPDGRLGDGHRGERGEPRAS